MAAVAVAPGLSALLAWPTEHLTEAASHWETVGERSYGVSHGMWRDALTVDWDGETADALRTDTHADLMTTSAVVDQLQSAASVARSGASDLDAARSQMRYAVEDARSAGYEVGEDLSVTDRMSGDSAAQQAARQAEAQSFAASIGGRESGHRGRGRHRVDIPAAAAEQRASACRRQPYVQARSRQTAASLTKGS